MELSISVLLDEKQLTQELYEDIIRGLHIAVAGVIHQHPMRPRGEILDHEITITVKPDA